MSELCPTPTTGGDCFASACPELELLIRARYPVLYVVTWEESRVEAQLAEIAIRRGKTLHTWSVTEGLRDVTGSGGGRSKRMSDPVEALDEILEYKDRAIYVFRDLHPFMNERPCNAPVRRKLREVARGLASSYKTLVITAPLLDLAPELEKDVTIIDYPLPGRADFHELLDRIDEEVAGNSKVTIDLDAPSRERLVDASMGLTIQEAENVFAKTLVNDGRLDANDVSVIFSEKQQVVRKTGLLECIDPESGLGGVGGLENFKLWTRKRSAAFSRKARQFGLPAPRGVLLVGVQGCGKSLCAKAMASEWGMPLLRFDMGRMFSSLVGSSEGNVRRAIAVAESVAPAVLWVDEIDKAFAGAGASAGSDGGTGARVMSTFLTWLSEKTKPVFIFATANDISHLPPELLRKGRLDEIFFVDLPSIEERSDIFKIHIEGRGRDAATFDLDRLASEADGFSGAEIEQAIISALYDVFDAGQDLTTDAILSSIRETVPLSQTMSEQVAALRAWSSGRARAAGVDIELLQVGSGRFDF